jgi:dienelactone hydrolase
LREDKSKESIDNADSADKLNKDLDPEGLFQKANFMIQIQNHIYSDGEETLIGKLVRDNSRDNSHSQPRPGILITPAFGGLGTFEIECAESLAALGYVVLAIDYYGQGKQASSEEEAFALMSALNTDRPRLLKRMIAALNEIRSFDFVDQAKIGAMGYCFGGKGVLDLARSGEDFAAAVSIHGVYDAPKYDAPDSHSAKGQQPSIRPATLILHGWDDPLSPPDALASLNQELTTRCQDWQVLTFGHTGHAFTNPNANKPERGSFYQPQSARRAWQALLNFFNEKLPV